MPRQVLTPSHYPLLPTPPTSLPLIMSLFSNFNDRSTLWQYEENDDKWLPPSFEVIPLIQIDYLSLELFYEGRGGGFYIVSPPTFTILYMN